MFVRHGTDDRSVTGCGNAPSTKWRSFHVYLPGSVDLFLVRHFYPALAEAFDSRRIRRFFFIRYLDQGLHLRLRFMLGKTAGPFSLEEWLGRMLQEFSRLEAGTLPCRIEQHHYDRTSIISGKPCKRSTPNS